MDHGTARKAACPPPSRSVRRCDGGRRYGAARRPRVNGERCARKHTAPRDPRLGPTDASERPCFSRGRTGDRVSCAGGFGRKTTSACDARCRAFGDSSCVCGRRFGFARGARGAWQPPRRAAPRGGRRDVDRVVPTRRARRCSERVCGASDPWRSRGVPRRRSGPFCDRRCVSTRESSTPPIG